MITPSSETRIAATVSDSDRWTVLSDDEARLVLDDVNRYVLPLTIFEAGTTVIRKRQLNFYDLDWLEIRSTLWGEESSLNVLWKTGFAHPANFNAHTSDAIQRVNERLSRQGWRLRRETVAEYVRFFFEHVWQDGAPRRIIEHKTDGLLCFENTDLKTASFYEAASLVEALDEIDEIAIGNPDQRGEASAFLATAHLFHEGELCRATIEIEANGAVHIGDAMVLLACEPTEGACRSRSCAPEPIEASLRLPSDDFEALSAEGFVEKVVELDQKTADYDHTDSDLGPRMQRPREIVLPKFVVRGSVNLSGRTMHKRLIIRDCRFRGPVDLSSMTCESDLVISNCVFEQGISFSGADIRGALFVSCTALASGFEKRKDGITVHERPAIDGARLCVDGNVNFAAVAAIGDVVLSQSRVAGFTTLRSSLGQPQFDICGSVELTNLRTEGLFVRGIRVRRQLSIWQCTIRQSVDIHALEGYRTIVGNGIRLGRTVIERAHLSMDGLDVHNGGIDARFLRTGTGLYLGTQNLGVEIAGWLRLQGAELPKLLRVGPCRICGSLDARSLKAGEVRLQSNWLMRDSAEKRDIDANDNAEPELVVSIDGAANFSSARIDGDACFIGLRAGADSRADGTGGSQFSLSLRGAQVGGDVVLFPDFARPAAYGIDPQREQQFVNHLPFGISLRKAQLEGDVDMSHVDCSQGFIDLTDATVARDVAVCERKHEVDRTRVKAFIMDGLDCRGGVDITGLTVEPEPPDAVNAEGPDGHVLARKHVQIAKDLRVGAHTDDVTGQRIRAADIPGRLDLSFSKLGGLEVSSHLFEGKHKNATCDERCFEQCLRTYGIILNRANIGKLSVHVEPDLGSAFPRPIDLGYTDIRWWEFCRGAGKRTMDRHQDYTELLAGDRNIQRHVWASIEQNLYDRGNDEAADEIHRAMRKCFRERAKKELEQPGQHWAKRLRQRADLVGRTVFDCLTASTTSPWRLLALMVLWFGVSSYIFSLPLNIVPSELVLGARQPVAAVFEFPKSANVEDQIELAVRYDLARHPTNWSAGDAMWMALRYHVPIVRFSAREEWAPASEDGPEPGEYRYLVTPEQYANLVLLAHWLAWSIVLIIATKRFLRRARD